MKAQGQIFHLSSYGFCMFVDVAGGYCSDILIMRAQKMGTKARFLLAIIYAFYFILTPHPQIVVMLK